jgi:hypothetical protein
MSAINDDEAADREAVREGRKIPSPAQSACDMPS